MNQCSCELVILTLDWFDPESSILAMKLNYYCRVQVVEFMLNTSVSMAMFERIDDSKTFDPDYYIDPFNTPQWAAHDHGTSHLSVLGENGDAVSVTNSINT